ncbi:hypothetical protein [Lutibacter sp.]
MKRQIVILVNIIIISSSTISQTLGHLNDIKSPEVSALQQIKFTPNNDYTGRANIEIPIYTINLDGLLIPISISYNTGGVKVNSISTRVGLNWSLNAGGFINREIMGDDDFVGQLTFGSNYSGVADVTLGNGGSFEFTTAPTSSIYTRFGFLGENNYYLGYERPNSRIDRQPDIYFVEAPGLITKFTNKSDMEILELTPTGSKFIATVQNSSSTEVFTYSNFNITSSKGFIYNFNQRESSSDSFINYQGEINEHETINTAFCCSSASGQTFNRLSSLFLSYIKNPSTGNIVEFQYIDNLVEDFNLRIEREFKIDGSFYQQFDHFSDFLNEKIINKILFKEGEIEFYYNSDRDDLIGAKRLTKIEIRNTHSEIIKSIHFVQDYFTSSDNCNEPKCLRLRLNEIYFEDKDKNVLPGYKFGYNSKKLPKRYSYKQDFLGYYNSANVDGTYFYIPRMYFKENEGKYSYIPFNIPNQGYSTLFGNYSLNSDINYSKAASLEKIIYPEKGYETFEYELNSFIFLGEEIQGGGLRLKSNKIFNFDNSLKRQKDYLYEDENGSSTGSVLYSPRFIKLNLPHFVSISQRSTNNNELGSSYVGYSKVKISENNNGYIINEYISPKEILNEYPASYALFNTNQFTSFDIATNAFNLGLFPNLFENMENKRGKLISSKLYSSDNVLRKELINTYSYGDFESIITGSSLIMSTSIGEIEDMIYEPYALVMSKVNSERNLLTNTIQKEYFPDGELITEKIIVYDNVLPFIKEITSIVNDNQLLKQKFYYPYNQEFSSLTVMTGLQNQNIISNVVQSETYKNDILLSTKRTNYKDLGNNIILPESIQTAKGVLTPTNLLKDRIVYHNYDGFGNPIEISKSDGTHIVYIWGYNETQPIAKIENATYADVQSFLATAPYYTSIEAIQNSSNLDNDRTIDSFDLNGAIIYSGNEGTLRENLHNLRTVLPNSQVTTYTYDPLIGVTSITDPRGETIYYYYDSFNRLKFVKDAQGNILSENQYHYKNQQ